MKSETGIHDVQQEWHDEHSGLTLRGKSTDHIWTMEDGAEPHIIGLRMDSGDSGVVYLTREQAREVIECLKFHLTGTELPSEMKD